MTGRRVLVAVLTDGPGAALLQNHPGYNVVFAAPDGTKSQPADAAATDAETETVSPAPLLYDYVGVAQRLRLSERKVRQLVTDGQLPAVRVGRCRRIRAVDLDNFVEGLGDQTAPNRGQVAS